ncbi:MAG: glycoside hydrolase family 43 protein [Opitutaceae bacterium]
MKRLRRLLRLCALLLLGAWAEARAESDVFLFTYFVGNGADGLHLAWSEDGYHWQALGDGASFLAPQIGKDRLMRDPSVARGPDGTYHLVWTTGWWDRQIGHAYTRDFIHWSEQQAVPVMETAPTARNAWAPELTWDPALDRFLIYWATTIPGAFPETAASSEDGLNHRIYSTSTADWRTFAPTRLFCDPGFSVIDAALLPLAEGDFALIVKDETVHPPRKHLRIARAASAEGPWREFAAPFTRDWVEGPTALRLGDTTIVYFDIYKEKHYGAMRSRDLVHWDDVTAQISVPAGARHGTMIAVPRPLVDALRSVPRPPVRLP